MVAGWRNRGVHTLNIALHTSAHLSHTKTLQAYEPRIAVYGASLHNQEPDVAVAVGKDGYLKV